MPVEPSFPVLDVSGWEVIADETSGVEEKYWLQAPGSSTRWLFKTVTIKDGQVYGEDWAEKAVSELARLVGVPCARIELALLRGRAGCISADLRPASHELQHGQVLLQVSGAPGYVHGTGRVHPGHTLENIRTSLAGALPPPNCHLPFDATAYDVSPATCSWTHGSPTGIGTIITGLYFVQCWSLTACCDCAAHMITQAAWAST